MTDDSEKGGLHHTTDLENGGSNALLPPPPPSTATIAHAHPHPTSGRTRTWPEYFHYILTPEILKRKSVSGGDGHGRRSTAYLDGFRGVAAFLVYLGHHVLGAHGGDNRPIEYGYGYKGEYRFVNIPYIRTIFSGGHFSVAIFFVISGFVLARKPITLMHAREFDAASKNIGSGMFRRGIRLFMPVIVSSFIYMSTWHIFGVKVGWPEPKATYAAEIRSFFSDFLGWSFVLRDRGFPIFAYNFPAWSLPVEYQGSMVTFALLIAFARIKIRARLILTTVLALYFLHLGSWSCFCFLWGQTLAELDLLVSKKSPSLPRWFMTLATSSLFCNLLLLFGLFLGGQPHTPDGIKVMEATPVWSVFAKLMPTHYREGESNVYWLSWAGVSVTTAVVFLPWTHTLFNRPLCSYLGRVSFAFYLTHGPILWTLGARLYAATGSNPLHDEDLQMYNDLFPLPQWGPYGAELGFWICQAFLIPFSLFWAEVTMRAIDEPSVTLAQFLFRKVAGK